MSSENFKRKLSAILSADVEGYSRLMGEDEGTTVKNLETYKGVMSTLNQRVFLLDRFVSTVFSMYRHDT